MIENGWDMNNNMKMGKNRGTQKLDRLIVMQGVPLFSNTPTQQLIKKERFNNSFLWPFDSKTFFLITIFLHFSPFGFGFICFFSLFAQTN